MQEILSDLSSLTTWFSAPLSWIFLSRMYKLLRLHTFIRGVIHGLSALPLRTASSGQMSGDGGFVEGQVRI